MLASQYLLLKKINIGGIQLCKGCCRNIADFQYKIPVWSASSTGMNLMLEWHLRAQESDLWYELLHEFSDKQFWKMSSSDHFDHFLLFGIYMN